MKMKCDFCKKMGSQFYVMLHLEQTVPVEINRFKVLAAISFYHSIIECPVCHTFFDQRRVIDNEPRYSSDEIEFKEITAAQAQEMVDYVKKVRSRFFRQINLRLKGVKQLLSSFEMEIIGVFKKKMLESISIYEIKENVKDFDEGKFMAAFASLVSRGVLRQYSDGTITHYRLT